jgi:pimeloyl-ACP methyl ester carboxylesterase
MEYSIDGSGPAVLLIHGAMGGLDQSVLLGRAALGEAAFQRIAVSRPGYLGTPLSEGASPELQADACAALLDQLRVEQVAVIAISGGGQCALQFALRHPGRTRCLALISACSAPIREPIPVRFHLMRWIARSRHLSAWMRRSALRAPEQSAARSVADPTVLARTIAHPEAWPLWLALQASTLDRMGERMPGTVNDIRESRRPFDYPLESLRPRTLIIHGSADRMAPPDQARALAWRAPRAQLVEVPGGEHVTLFTHLDLVREAVLKFLD